MLAKPFYVIGPFCTQHSICLNILIWQFLYGNDAFSVLVLSTKKQYSRLLKKFFVFRKISFEVKVLKTFKISTDCQIKTCRSLKLRAILKITSIVFEKNLCSFCWLYNETSKKKRFPVLRQKPTKILR